MKKYILYTLLLVFAANVGYAQDREAIEAAKKRLLELKAKKAQIEEEMQEILQPDKIVTTEIKDGVRTETVELKEETPLPLVSKLIKDEDTSTKKNATEVVEDKISRREKRKQKRTQNTYTAIEDKKEEVQEPETPVIEIVEETPEIEVEEEIEIDEPKLSRRERRRQREIENTDIIIEEPEIVEEIEVTIEEEMPKTQEVEVVEETPEVEVEEEIEIEEPKLSRRERRRQREIENTDIIIEEPEIVEEIEVTIEEEMPKTPEVEVVKETPEIEIEEEIEVDKPKLSRRERRRQREIENTDIIIEEPEIVEEIEVTIEEEMPKTPEVEVVKETPEIEIEEEIEVDKPKLSRRERRRQREIENTDIIIEEPEIVEEIEVTIEEEMPKTPEVEVVEETPEIEIEEEIKIEEPKLSRRERRRQREIENTDIIIEEPEIVEEIEVTIEPEPVKQPEIEIIEKEPATKPEKPKALVPKVESEVEEAVMETPSAPKVEVNIQSTAFQVEEAPQLEIEAKIPEIEIPSTIEEEVKERPVKLSRKERRKLRQAEDFVMKVDIPEEVPEVEAVEENTPKSDAITIVKDPEEEAIIAEIENAAEQKTRLSIDVVDMPNAEPLGVRLSDEASLAMTDILTAQPPESVPPEVTFYDAKLKLIVGEMEALVSKSALLPSGMKRINDKLSTIESQLLKFDDMRSEPETAKYMNFMQMNIDILQNVAGDSNANAPDAMLMEPEPTPPPAPTSTSAAAPAPQGAQKVYFMRDSDDIGFRFKKELEAIAATAKDIPGFYLIIDSMNERLQNESVISKSRAENIREFLQEEGVASEQIRSRYFGNTSDELAARPAMIIQIVDN